MRNTRIESIVTVVFTLIIFAFTFNNEAATKFYHDDPIWVDPNVQDASGIKAWETDVIYDALENLFSNPGDETPNVRAQNINTIGEVPDSNWYTNRAGKVTITPEMIEKGPNTGNGPAPEPGQLFRQSLKASRRDLRSKTALDKFGFSNLIHLDIQI